MTTEQITARIEELRNTAKQHEAVLLQISGAIQELQNWLAQESKEMANAPDQINDT
jgi:prefoldin subunit 5